MNKGILIDIGGTIIHNNNINYEKALSILYDNLIIHATREVFVAYSYDLLMNIFNQRKLIEFKMYDYICYLKKYFKFDSVYSLEKLEEIFAENSCVISEVRDIRNLLAYFKNKQYKIIALSNTSFSRNVINKTLGELSIYLDEIIISSECIFRKPHKNIFELGIKKIALPKKDIYYIGNDFYCDIYGSYNAGINSVWFNEFSIKNNISKDNTITYLEIKSYVELICKGF